MSLPGGASAQAAQAMSWLLDTDVICQPAKKSGDAKVIAWLETEQDRCYTSAVVIAQLASWVQDERRPAASGAASLAHAPLVDALHGRIHGFNVSVAHVWAEQERLLDKAGQRMPVEDSYIAATARRHGLTIATGNDRETQTDRAEGLQSIQGTGVADPATGHRWPLSPYGSAGRGRHDPRSTDSSDVCRVRRRPSQ